MYNNLKNFQINSNIQDVSFITRLTGTKFRIGIQHSVFNNNEPYLSMKYFENNNKNYVYCKMTKKELGDYINILESFWKTM